MREVERSFSFPPLPFLAILMTSRFEVSVDGKVQVWCYIYLYLIEVSLDNVGGSRLFEN